MSLAWRTRYRLQGIRRVSPTSAPSYHDDAIDRHDGGIPVITKQRECRALAEKLLRSYRLNPTERAEETERLTEQIVVAIDAHLESLEDRKA